MLYCTSTVCKKVQHERQWTWVTLMDSTKLRNKIKMLRLSLPPKQYICIICIFAFSFWLVKHRVIVLFVFFLSRSRSPRPTSRRPGCGCRRCEWQQRRLPTLWPTTPWGLALRSWCRWTCRCHDALLCSLRPSARVRPHPWDYQIFGVRFFKCAKWCNDIAPKSQQQT